MPLSTQKSIKEMSTSRSKLINSINKNIQEKENQRIIKIKYFQELGFFQGVAENDFDRITDVALNKLQKEIDKKEKLKNVKIKNNKKELLEIKEKDKEAKKKEELLEKYGAAIANKLLNKELWLNMDSQMLKESLGKPFKKVENASNGKIKIINYYNKSTNRLGNEAFDFKVTLFDGFVTGWKDRRTKGTRTI